MRYLVPIGSILVFSMTVACDSFGPIPPPGPHFSVLPIPMEDIVRISALGQNNKILPVGHTYWDVCDRVFLLGGGPCEPGRRPIQAPGDGEVRDIEEGPDGVIAIEGPPGLVATFAHVTPAPGLGVGDRVAAGDVVAQMYLEESFDFGVRNPGREPREFLVQSRYPDGYVYAEHPIEQYPEPLRSQLEARVRTFEDPIGKLSFDVAGTAQGNWFLPGTPHDASFNVENANRALFLGRLQERHETRILVVGQLWPGMEDRLSAVDEAAPGWDEITPADGAITLKLWRMGSDAEPNTTWPHGTALVEMLDAERVRLEWFSTHEPVAGFTPQARTYER